MSHLENVIVVAGKTVRDIFRIQDSLTVKLSVLTENERLVGVISDGDIRRFILSGGNLDCYAEEIAVTNPVTAFNITDAAKMLNKHPNLKLIPIVDSDKHVLDLYFGQTNNYNSIDLPVVINAGGKGTRLDPYTKILPKPLIPVGDVPVIELIMQEFNKYGCNEYSIILNYKKQMIKAYFSYDEINNELKNDNYNIQWVDEIKPLKTGGGLRLLQGKLSGTFFFTNCDTLVLTDYSCILDLHRREKNMVTMVCAYKNLQLPYGVVKTKEGGQIEEIHEKPEMSFLTNVGMYLVEPEVIVEISEDEAIDFTDVIDRLMKKNMRVGVYPVSEAEWLDMGQPEQLERMRKIIEGRIIK